MHFLLIKFSSANKHFLLSFKIINFFALLLIFQQWTPSAVTSVTLICKRIARHYVWLHHAPHVTTNSSPNAKQPICFVARRLQKSKWLARIASYAAVDYWTTTRKRKRLTASMTTMRVISRRSAPATRMAAMRHRHVSAMPITWPCWVRLVCACWWRNSCGLVLRWETFLYKFILMCVCICIVAWCILDYCKLLELYVQVSSAWSMKSILMKMAMAMKSATLSLAFWWCWFI